MKNEWIGVDFDGTMAEYHGWSEELGAPIPAMAALVRGWLEQGKDVRIVTARVNEQEHEAGVVDKQRAKIQAWCFKHLDKVLPVVCTKDQYMLELWDDRAFHVRFNAGIPTDADITTEAGRENLNMMMKDMLTKLPPDSGSIRKLAALRVSLLGYMLALIEEGLDQ